MDISCVIELETSVPAPDCHLDIRKSGGIVGSTDRRFPGEVLIDYKGALYGQKMSWECAGSA
jgi:hypothetical protein